MFKIMQMLLNILPKTTFLDKLQDYIIDIKDYLGWINWLIPFYAIVPTLKAWLGAITAVFGYKFIRKYIEQLIERKLRK